MLGKIFSHLGGTIGGMFGGGILSTVGKFAGKMLGSYLEDLEQEPIESSIFKNIRAGFQFHKAEYGQLIPLVFGTMKVNGKIFWLSKTKISQNNSQLAKNFVNSNNHKTITTIVEYNYTLSIAYMLCDGEIQNITRTWLNYDELFELSNYQYKIYYGNEVQTPDPKILEAEHNQAPAFRGMAYIVFYDLPLSDFDNQIPNFFFEVVKKANFEIDISVENMTRSITMIPGSGEFVYDPVIQYKTVVNEDNLFISKTKINSFNYADIANSVHSLNQLISTCPNIQWIAPVVCWFGNSSNAKDCIIEPAVEFNDKYSTVSEEWQSGFYNRSNTRVISQDEFKNPRYGGTPSDGSIMRYLEEVKSRGIKIMFYPMFFLDIDQKPWRGHLKAQSFEDIDLFFNHNGYKKFILHYANLVKNHVNAFIIGSELIGLTKFNHQNQFPAVEQLIYLAQEVKNIMGKNVKITYAADWSEYHHTVNGWYNLDKLWASNAIDFIGIDAYFPITNNNSTIKPEEIIQGFNSGEGYNFYYDNDNQTKHPIEPQYAWKNIKYWWENNHINPDGSKTEWTPKMKKIWFTEFGFPSIDKATNQPNVFYDPKCFDGGVPKYSSGKIDFAIQRKAIKAFYQFWGGEEYIENMFLWTWDARPFPIWPYSKLWKDGYLWSRGHWINNKFGTISIASILTELSIRAGIDYHKIYVDEIEISLEGIIFNKSISIMDAINLLRISYFFDVISNYDNEIKFVKRQKKLIHKIDFDDLIKSNTNNYIDLIDISSKNIINNVKISFINKLNNYYQTSCSVNSDNLSNIIDAKIILPIAMSYPEAQDLGRKILITAQVEKTLIKFSLPISYYHLEPGDFIQIEVQNYKMDLRIISYKISNLIIEVTAIVDTANSYNQLATLEYEIPYNVYENKLRIIEVPSLDLNSNNHSLIGVFLQDDMTKSLYISFDTNCYNRIATIKPGASIGKVIFEINTLSSSIFVIDHVSRFTIECQEFNAYKDQWNFGYMGGEYIWFKNFTQLGGAVYQIRNIIRGTYNTNHLISKSKIDTDFILINDATNYIELSPKIAGSELNFKIDKMQFLLDFQDKFNYLPKALLKDYFFDCDNLNLRWIIRSFSNLPNEYNSLISCYKNSELILENKTDIPELIINLAQNHLSGLIKIIIVISNQQGIQSQPLKLYIDIENRLLNENI